MGRTMRVSRVKMGLLKIAAASAALAVGVAGQAQQNERQFPGQLDSKSPKEGRQPYQVRTMALEAGQRYAFSAESEDFDPALRLSFADDNDEMLAEDDDGGDGTNAYLEFVPERSGTYRLRVSAVSDSKGSYVLKVRDLAPLPAPVRPKAEGASTVSFKHYSGALTTTDGEVQGRRVDDYVFHFQAGKQVFLFLDGEKDKLDPLIEVYPASGRYSSEPLAQDDDGGDDVNAFLLFTPEESGDYIVRATSAGEERTLGSYQLRVGEKP